MTTDTAMPMTLPIALNGAKGIRRPPRTRQCRDPTDRPKRCGDGCVDDPGHGSAVTLPIALNGEEMDASMTPVTALP